MLHPPVSTLNVEIQYGGMYVVANVHERLWLKVPEAAEMLSLGKSTLHELINQGKIRPVRVGRAIRIPVSEVRRFAEERLESYD